MVLTLAVFQSCAHVECKFFFSEGNWSKCLVHPETFWRPLCHKSQDPIADICRRRRLSGEALQFAADKLRSDREVVMEAVRKLNPSLKELQGGSNFLLRAMRKDCVALSYAAEELRGDREIVMQALWNHRSALKYATEKLLGDRAFMMQAVGLWGGEPLKFATSEVRGDRNIVMKAAWTSVSISSNSIVPSCGKRVLAICWTPLEKNARTSKNLSWRPQEIMFDCCSTEKLAWSVCR